TRDLYTRVDSNSCGPRRRLLRASGGDPYLEQVPAVVLHDHTTGYRCSSPAVLDPRACRDHALLRPVAGPDLGRSGCASFPADRAGFVYRHAGLERTVLHSRDAGVSEDTRRIGADR